MSEVISTINMISEALTELAANIQQITVGVDQISAMVQTNFATSEESATAYEALSGQASILKQLVAQFKKQIQRQIREELLVSDGDNSRWQETYSYGEKY